MSIWQFLGTIAVLMFVAVAAIVADRQTRPPQWYGTPQLDIGVPLAYELTRGPQTVRREFVATHITSSPEGTFVELRDRESYERANRIR